MGGGGIIKTAVGDAVVTFMFVFCASTIGLVTWLIESSMGINAAVGKNEISTISINVLIFFILLYVFGLIADALGGASFNPTGDAAFYAAGLGGDSLVSLALRCPAQAVGAVGGALAIVEVMPKQYKHMIGGPSLKVDLHTGAIAEGVLTFIITFCVLLIVIKGPNNPLVKTWLLAMTTVTLVVSGSKYTGPSMNPANAYGWAYVNNLHNTWEQFYVYWIPPFVGAILAAWVFRFFCLPSAPQPKKQKKA